MPMDFFKKKVLVVGLGKSGLSVARWLRREGAEVTISDQKSDVDIERGFIEKISKLSVNLETGGHRKETFFSSNFIVVSPGVPLDMEPLKTAIGKGIPVMGEMELAGRMIDTPLVAVTGTNGKSTATTLLGSILERAGHSLFVGGNIGTPLMDYAAGDQQADFAVVEVSSFQLDTMEKFCPMVSILLNISPDHLDRYPDYEAYARSKLGITRNQGPGATVILNDDDEKLTKFEPPGKPKVLRYGFKKGKGRHAYIEAESLRAFSPQGGVFTFSLERFSLPGGHNLANLMGVVLAALALSVEHDIIQGVIDDFQGLPDRLEWVGTLKGVDFYNDSKATNVDAALKSITSFERPVILIAGGRHKGGDYAPLVRASTGRVKSAVFMGEAKSLLAKSFQGVIPFALAEDMQDALSRAFASARTDDVVLLAPACSSFDMFSDYAHRGRIFRQEVEGLLHGG